MPYPAKLYRFGKSDELKDLCPKGHLSFGFAGNYASKDLAKGQRDDETKRTIAPSPESTKVFVGAGFLQNLTAIGIGLGLAPYFMICFSLNYSEEMYREVDGDVCIEITDVPAFFHRFKKALVEQLPAWAAFAAPIQYWDFSHIPPELNQQYLRFLKNEAEYASQKEYRIVLLPPEGFQIINPKTRQSVILGSLEDIASGRRKVS